MCLEAYVARHSQSSAGAVFDIDQRLFARRKHGPQPISRRRQFRERGLACFLFEASDQTRDRERAAELTGEVENGDGDGGHLGVALAQRYVIAALLYRLRLRAFGTIGEGEQHMGAGTCIERQLGALIEVVARGLRRIVPKQAHTGLTLTDIEGRRLAGRLHQAAQLRPDRRAEIEPGPVDRSQSPERRAEPEHAALVANEIAEPLQRAGEAQDRALVEARCRRDLAERHRRLVSMERVEHGKRAFDRLDLIFAHPGHRLSCLIRKHSRTLLRCTEYYATQKDILLHRTSWCRNGRTSRGDAGARSDQRACRPVLLLSTGAARRRRDQGRSARLRRSRAPAWRRS